MSDWHCALTPCVNILSMLHMCAHSTAEALHFLEIWHFSFSESGYGCQNLQIRNVFHTIIVFSALHWGRIINRLACVFLSHLKMYIFYYCPCCAQKLIQHLCKFIFKLIKLYHFLSSSHNHLHLNYGSSKYFFSIWIYSKIKYL